jgi:hypothetical protein
MPSVAGIIPKGIYEIIAVAAFSSSKGFKHLL